MKTRKERVIAASKKIAEAGNILDGLLIEIEKEQDNLSISKGRKFDIREDSINDLNDIIGEVDQKAIDVGNIKLPIKLKKR